MTTSETSSILRKDNGAFASHISDMKLFPMLAAASAAAILLTGCGALDQLGAKTQFAVELPEKFELEDAVDVHCAFDPAEHSEWYDDVCNQILNYQMSVSIPENLKHSAAPWFIDSVMMDHPDAFWISTYYKSSTAKTTDFRFELNDKIDKDKLSEMHQQLLDKADEIISMIPDGASDYDKALFVHDYIAKNSEYDHPAAADPDVNPMAFNAYGCLIEGKCVCAGYARAYSLILKRLGIECCYSWGYPYSGESHAWNYVMIDGKYYWVDVTWDDMDAENDGGPAVVHTYFMINDDMLRRTRKSEWEQIFAPECSSTDLNYHVKNGTFFTGYDKDSVASAISAQKDNGCAEIMFADYDSYCSALTGLFGKGDIYKGIDVKSDTFKYYRDDRMYTLYFIF